MDSLVDYLNFAIQRAIRLHEQLDKSKITPPAFVSDFFNDREFYKPLDPQKYKDAKPSFIFCGLIHEACTILIKRGENIKHPTYDLLTTSYKAVRIMVLLIEEPESIQTQANLAALIAEFKTLEADFKHNQSNMKDGDETFQQKVQLQLSYLQDTLSALDGKRRL